MTHHEFQDVMEAWREGTLSEAQAHELNSVLRESEDARRIFKDEAQMHALLHRAVMASSVDRVVVAAPESAEESAGTTNPPWFRKMLRRPLVSTAVGVALGLFAAAVFLERSDAGGGGSKRMLVPVVWQNPGGAEGRITFGFPKQIGIVGGDEAEWVTSGAGRVSTSGKFLRFLKAGRAGGKTCDVFQMVDVSRLKALSRSGEVTLEFSASFADAGAEPDGKLRFGCHVHILNDKPEDAAKTWPRAMSEAWSTGANFVTPEAGSKGGRWNRITAKCVLPEGANWVLLQVSATQIEGAGVEPAEFGGQFAGDFELVFRHRK